MSYSLYQHFEATCCFHPQGRNSTPLFIFIFALCISSIKNTFYYSNWCTLL